VRLSKLSLVLALLVGALPACQATPATVVPVDAVGVPTPTTPGGPPDEATRQLAITGANTAVLLGPAVRELAQLTGAFYQAKDRYTRYRVMSGPEGWDYRNGWYWRTDSAEGRSLRARFEDESGVGAAFDVTFDVNYGPEMHPSFPRALTQLRAELDQPLPSGGKLSVTLLAVLPGDRSARVEAYGSGAAVLPLPLGQVGLEALNASFMPGGTVERGDLVLKSLTGGATRQFSGRYHNGGLDGGAQVRVNAELVGEVGFFDGQWQLRNTSGNHPL
jgi:hypothetical protein